MINIQKINKVILKSQELEEEFKKLNSKEIKYLKLYTEIILKIDEMSELEK